MTATEARTDAKAGFCSNCRRGDHGLCASPSCACTSKALHGNRPAPVRRPSQIERPVIGARAKAAAQPRSMADLPIRRAGTRPKPLFEAVKEAPPPPVQKKQLVELVRPALEAILTSEDRDWWRVCLYPSPTGASMAMGKLRKRYGTAEWEWRSGVHPEHSTCSAVWVRWTGKQPVPIGEATE